MIFKHPTATLLSVLLLSTLTAPAVAEKNPVDNSVAAETSADTSPDTSDSSMPIEEAEQLFSTAMYERDTGKVFSSIEKFEYILSRRPSLNRARLELAVSYQRASRYEDAKREFQTVLDDPDTPEKVRLAILAYLGQIASDQKKPQSEHSFSYYTKIGALYNTNINFAPLRGSPDYQIPDGEDTASPGLDTFLSASHRYRDNKPFDTAGASTFFEWQSQVSWTGNNYTRNSDFSLNIFSASTGPAAISAGRWNGAISLQVDQTYFGTSILGTFVSLNPLLTFDLGNYKGLTFELSYTDNNFRRQEDQDRDGDTLLGGIAYSTLLGGVDNGLEAGLRITDHNAEDNQYGFASSEIYFGGFLGYGANDSFYLNLNFEDYNFDAADTVSGTVRDELESRYLIGYNHDFAEGSLQGWTLNTYLQFTKNNSNVDAFSYERTVFAINLARYFL